MLGSNWFPLFVGECLVESGCAEEAEPCRVPRNVCVAVSTWESLGSFFWGATGEIVVRTRRG